MIRFAEGGLMTQPTWFEGAEESLIPQDSIDQERLAQFLLLLESLEKISAELDFDKLFEYNNSAD